MNKQQHTENGITSETKKATAHYGAPERTTRRKGTPLSTIHHEVAQRKYKKNDC